MERAWFSRDMRSVYAKLSNSRTITFEWSSRAPGSIKEEVDPSTMALPHIISIKADDGQDMFGSILLPRTFDPSKKYPVHFEIYGGPNTAYVTDRWRIPDQWWSDNGIIHIVADGRAAGHTGRDGRDMVFRDLTTVPVKDFVAGANWAKSQPYVDGDHLGVEGFSFGGTMTAMLLLPAFSLAGDVPSSDIRVLLRRLALSDRADLTVSGCYLARSDSGAEFLLSDNTKITVLLLYSINPCCILDAMIDGYRDGMLYDFLLLIGKCVRRFYDRVDTRW